jgi:outer membrane protein assembly factor BamB
VAGWAAGGLFLVFLALAGYEKFYVNRARFVPDEALLEELSGATLLDDEGPAAEDAPWPQWRGPRRDGVAHQPGLLTRWPAGGPKLLWEAKGGGGYSSFAVAGGRMFTVLEVEDDQGKQEVVVCRRADDKGEEVWRHTSTPARPFQRGGPRATPTVDGDRVYVLGGAGLLLCLKADTGKVLWQFDLLDEFKGAVANWGFASSPLVEGDRLFVMGTGGNGHALAAFDKRDGTPLWSALDDPPGYTSPVAVTVAGVRQVLFYTGTRLVGVSPADGKLLWQYPWANEQKINAATPLPFRARDPNGNVLHYVFLSSGYGKGCALVKVEPHGRGEFRARAVYQSNQLACHFATPVRRGNYLYGLGERDLTCLDLRSGEVCWRFGGGRRGSFQKGSLLAVDDYLLLLAEDGRLALARAEAGSYQEVASARPGLSHCWTVPVLADGRLYLRDESRVLCLDLRKR